MNNAAIFNKKGVIDMPLDEWRRQLEIILGGAFLFTKHVAKSMIEQRARAPSSISSRLRDTRASRTTSPTAPARRVC